MRKIFPAIAAGVSMLTVAGATFGYAATEEVRLTVDGSSRDVSTMASTVGQVLEREGIAIGPHDVVVPDPGTTLTDETAIAVQYGRRVTVTVDGVPRTFWTTATTVDEALAAQRIEVGSHDDLSTSRSSTIGRGGLEVAVSTQKTVTLTDAGRKKRLTTTAPTVADALVEAGVDVDADDVVRPAMTEPLTDGDRIRYTRVDTRLVTKRSEVEYETTYRKSRKLDRGETEVQRKGVAGERTTVVAEVRHDGKLVSEKTTSSKVTTAPRSAVVLRGTREVRSVLRGGEPADVGDGGGRRSQVFTTGYTYWDNSPPGSAEIARPQIHDRAGGVGTWKDPITVAVRSGRFAFGTRFYLPELKKYFIVEDLCGACNDGRNGGAYTLDLWVDGSHLSSGGAASCASRVTRVQPAIEDPKSSLPVDSGSVC